MMKLHQLHSEFLERYNDSRQQTRVFYAPGRVNLIGDHTDYSGGLVFPCAIDKGTTMLIRRRNDNLVKLASTNLEYTASLSPNEFGQKQGDHWVNYALGVIDQFHQKGFETQGFECLFSGNIPNGGGLSSSASLEVVTAFGLNKVFEANFSDIELVKIALAAENDFVNVKCGIMDQYATAMAQKNYAMMLDCNTLECEQIPLDLVSYRIVIINSNQKRGLVDSKYNERFQECKIATNDMQKKLNIKQLVEVTPEQFADNVDHFSNETIAKRAKHVINEHHRVKLAVAALKANDLISFGILMNQSHESMSKDFEASTSIIDQLVSMSQKTEGVIGARMTGGGFGGCTVNIVAENTVNQFIETVGEKYKKDCGLNADFYPIQSDNGMREITL